MKGKEKIRRRSEKSLDPSEKKPVRHYWNRIICVESEERTCSGFQREERERESMEVAVRESVEREREIEGHTRSLRPSSIRIPRISVNGPLLPRPFG